MSDLRVILASYYVIRLFKDDLSLRNDMVAGIETKENNVLIHVLSVKTGSGLSRNVREVCGKIERTLHDGAIGSDVLVSPFEAPLDIAGNKSKVFSYFKEYYQDKGIYIGTVGPNVHICDSTYNNLPIE